MNEILKKRCADMTVLEMFEFAELLNVVRNPTMTLEEFCKIVQKSKRRVYELLKNRIYPEELIVGGYASMKQRKSPVFDTKQVIEFIRIPINKTPEFKEIFKSNK